MAWSSASASITTGRPRVIRHKPKLRVVRGDQTRKVAELTRRQGQRRRMPRPGLGRGRMGDTASVWRAYQVNVSGLYRVFNAATYRFYRRLDAPPDEKDAPFATNATLPHTPTDTYSDGDWYLAVSYYNGVIDSGFLPLGPNGETYLRIRVTGGLAVNVPPQPPRDWRLQSRGNGVVRVLGFYAEPAATLRATQWAITYTTDGSEPGIPPAVSPTVTVTLGGIAVAALSYDLPAQTGGTLIKARLQSRRFDSAWVYSENLETKERIADTYGGVAGGDPGDDAPHTAEGWRGRLPEVL